MCKDFKALQKENNLKILQLNVRSFNSAEMDQPVGPCWEPDKRRRWRTAAQTLQTGSSCTGGGWGTLTSWKGRRWTVDRNRRKGYEEEQDLLVLQGAAKPHQGHQQQEDAHADDRRHHADAGDQAEPFPPGSHPDQQQTHHLRGAEKSGHSCIKRGCAEKWHILYTSRHVEKWTWCESLHSAIFLQLVSGARKAPKLKETPKCDFSL